MRAIYSVLIQNEKTLNSFEEFNELFIKALNRQEIGICKWNEAGTDIETALPDLLNLVDEKEEWRAIIVLTEHSKSDYETAVSNPYDFMCNQIYDNSVKECDIPLIRLTHILGGVPAPDLEFKCEKVEEPNKEARMIYKPVRDPEKEAAYEELKNKYSYSGKSPSEIIIVSVRDKVNTDNDDLRNIWDTKKEIESSEFWKRNKYPSKCRFIVYDLEKQGRTQKYSDMFNFWMSIMLISTNQINSNVMQAYRLYTLQSFFDKEEMTKSFQKIVYRLLGAQQYIKDSIRYEEKMRMLERQTLPEYQVEVPVTLDTNKRGGFSVDTTEFSLISDNGSGDYAKWESMKAEVEENLKHTYRLADRSLDEAADHARKICRYPEEMVYKLTEYQQEDMEEDLARIYDSVMYMQSKLPSQKKDVEKRLNDSAKKVRNAISMRINKGTLIGALVIALCTTLCAVVPGIAFSVSNKTGDTFNALLLVLLLGVVLAVTSVFVLINQKNDFNDIIKNYNQMVMNSVGEIQRNANLYSSYMSGITSHSRGASFLNIIKRKTLEEDIYGVVQRNALSDCERLLEKVRRWCIANYLSVEFKTSYYEEVMIDFESQKNVFMSVMEDTDQFPVYVNETGYTIESPFRFVKKLEIVREELYDDAQYS